MKLSVSLTEADVAILDEYVRSAGLPSRSAAVSKAVQMLRLPELELDYQRAWVEWEESGDSDDWDALAGDGLDRAPR